MIVWGSGRRQVLLRAFVFAMLISVAATAYAQTRRYDNDCNPRDYNELEEFQQNICASHAACNAIGKFADRACTAVNFLRNIKGVFSTKGKISGGDVLEAASDPIPKTPLVRRLLDKLLISDEAETSVDR